MSGEHFTLTISQSTNESGDFAIHLKDRKRDREHFLMHIRFAESIIVDDAFMDDLVAIIARCMAKKLLGQQILDDEGNFQTGSQEEARKVVEKALEKMRKA